MDTNRLPLTLKRRINEQPPSTRLPLTLGRKLGEIDSGHPIIPPTPPVTPVKRRMMVMSEHHISIETGRIVSHCLSDGVLTAQLSYLWQNKQKIAQAVAYCKMYLTAPFVPLAYSRIIRADGGMVFWHCQFIPSGQAVHYQSCKSLTTAAIFGYSNCFGLGIIALSLQQCHTAKTTQAVSFGEAQTQSQRGYFLAECRSLNTSPTYAVPCRFYPIPEPPIPPSVQACRIRPPSYRLPLALKQKTHKIQGFSSSALPFNLRCWHDDAPDIIPSLRAYIMHHTISATIAGIHINPISFHIKTEMSGFCWQGQIEISQEEYLKLQPKLNVAKGLEPLLVVTIDDVQFCIICEHITHQRRFAHHSVSLSGRSLSARASSDYSFAQAMQNTDLYASQLVRAQLTNLPITIDTWAVADWLIAQDTYTGNDKAPIAIINDIAQACGGFIYSHPSKPSISLLPRYKVAAWALATSKPDKVISIDSVLTMTDTKRVNPRYNTVTLVGADQGGIVYREREARDQDAPIVDNALIYDKTCIMQAGIAALSDSGAHSQISLEMPFFGAHALAVLGDIWQVNDVVAGQNVAWMGIVQNVSIDAKVSDGVPTVTQTVGLDRYEDV